MRDHILPYLDWVMYAVGALFVAWLVVQGVKAYRRKKSEPTQ